jgi:uncharacterized protein YegL
MNSVSEILDELVFQIATLEPPRLQRLPIKMMFEMPPEALVAEFPLKKPETVLSLLIDLSDSMRGGTQVKKDQPLHRLLLSMHEIVCDQAAKFPAAKVRVSTFSSAVEHGPLRDISAVCADGLGDFEASGCTAFFDSLISTIDLHYKECPGSTVVFVVVTDGVDNASLNSSDKAAAKVKYAEQHKGSVVFLGANALVVSQGEDLGIKRNIEYCPAAPGLVRASTSETVTVELERLTLGLPDPPKLVSPIGLHSQDPFAGDLPMPPPLVRSTTVHRDVSMNSCLF